MGLDETAPAQPSERCFLLVGRTEVGRMRARAPSANAARAIRVMGKAKWGELSEGRRGARMRVPAALSLYAPLWGSREEKEVAATRSRGGRSGGPRGRRRKTRRRPRLPVEEAWGGRRLRLRGAALWALSDPLPARLSPHPSRAPLRRDPAEALPPRPHPPALFFPPPSPSSSRLWLLRRGGVCRRHR